MKTLLLLAFLTLSLFAESINIAVATNVSYAIKALKAEFIKTHPTTKVQIILGSSGKLSAQIQHGAPYGLFMSANMSYVQRLFNAKIAITQPKVYAQGSLAFLSAKPRDFSKGINVLTEPSIKRIAIANPKTAPYGHGSLEAFKNANIYESIRSKLIYAQSASQSVTYALKATDIGLVATSALYTPKLSHLKEGVHWSRVDTHLYTPIKQGIVLLKPAKNSKAYEEFYDFIFSQKAKSIFTKFGYVEQ